MQGFFFEHPCTIHLPQKHNITKKHKELTRFLPLRLCGQKNLQLQ